MGHDKNQDRNPATMDHAKPDDSYQGVGSQGKGQGQSQGQGQGQGQGQAQDYGQGQGQNKGQGQNYGQGQNKSANGGQNDQAHRDMQQGDSTRPAQPEGSAPLDKDEHPINKTGSMQQNR